MRLRWAEQGKQELEKIQDYKAIMVKRERHDGKVGRYEYMLVKIRQKPLSVYMYFLDPPQERGTEVIYFPAQNGGKMWAHGVGVRKMFGTVSLDPNGAIAMKGNHYPISEIGLSNLVQRLIEVGEHDVKYGECEVKFLPGAKINGRLCMCLQVMHPVPAGPSCSTWPGSSWMTSWTCPSAMKPMIGLASRAGPRS